MSYATNQAKNIALRNPTFKQLCFGVLRYLAHLLLLNTNCCVSDNVLARQQQQAFRGAMLTY